MARKGAAATSKPKASSSKKNVEKALKIVQRTEESSEDEDELNLEDNEEISEDEDEEEGVDQEGMTKLMAALGEDGLDEFAQAELRALTGDEDEGSDDEDPEEEADESGDEEEEEVEVEVEEVDASEDEEDVEDEEEEEEEEDVPLDEVEDVEEDVVPRQKIEIDNKIALERIRETIKLDPSMPWTETLTLTYPETIDVDVDDDLNRELAFYKQALHSANAAKALAAKQNFPFTRPSDYFAEMVKSDAHMERIRQRLLDESATIKRSEDKRKEREGKKFGKQVQMEKLKERERSKKDMEERIKGLKRKRKGALDNAQEDGEGFDVAVEDAISDRPSKRGRSDGPGGKRGLSRQARDGKYGYGGPGKRAKQNTKDSTDEFVGRGSGGRGGRGGRGGQRGGGRGGQRGGGRGGQRGGASKRLGKSKRVTARSRT